MGKVFLIPPSSTNKKKKALYYDVYVYTHMS